MRLKLQNGALLIVCCLGLLPWLTNTSAQVATTRFVNASDSTCAGQSPCHASIQAAVSAAQAGDIVRIQPGQYREAVVIKAKNKGGTATEADRIVIEADPSASPGSVIVGSLDGKCSKGHAFRVESSRFVTIRGLAITRTAGKSILLMGGKKGNTAIRVERNRIVGGQGTKCHGGIDIAKQNADTLVVNNLIVDTKLSGLAFRSGSGGPHYVVGNTIHANGRNGIDVGKDQRVWLVNNSVTGNGIIAKLGKKDGFGIKRTTPAKKPTPELIDLRHNLLCGNTRGAMLGPMLDGADAANLTPSGAEGVGVVASPGCDAPSVVYALTGGEQLAPAPLSPLVDAGLDPRTLATLPTEVLEADFAGVAARPRDGGSGTAAFDIGAIEKGGDSEPACAPSETTPCYTGPVGTEGVGVCRSGTRTCVDGAFGACVGEVLPGSEVPKNGVDEDCNDKDMECAPGEEGVCYTGPAGTRGVGLCRAGTGSCQTDGTFGACTGQVLPAAEVADNDVDEDCDGIDLVSDPGSLPADPAAVATTIDPTVATGLADAAAFIHTGVDPIQKGVPAGTIKSEFVSVVRGRVLTRAGTPIPGVAITIHGHAEFGSTVTRVDGTFDVAVNGGTQLTVEYSKDGYLPVQRFVTPPWKDYAVMDDVVLVPVDAVVTTVDLSGASTSSQVARGSLSDDEDGGRQATLIIPPGTQARIYNANGTTRPVSSLNLRFTEYTVGDSGPQAMPGPLPATSAYTYAVSITADEAPPKIAGKDVLFDRAVPIYLENFVGFPVGEAVPAGYYDPDRGAWIPSEDGRVIRILGVNGGVAQVDINGDEVEDTPAALAGIGVTTAERERLAVLYPSGGTFWRVPLSHLSVWDMNWPSTPRRDPMLNRPAEPPRQAAAVTALEQMTTKPTCADGSVIECENQTLGEEIPIVGSPLRLVYRSDRSIGYRAGNVLRIPLLAGVDVASSIIEAVEVEITVAGRRFKKMFPAGQAPVAYEFEWNGLDAYGRRLVGSHPASVRVGYVYDAFYTTPTQNRPSMSFGAPGAPTVVPRPTRRPVTLWQDSREELGTLALGSEIGGWSLSAHHRYDPAAKVLYLGDGSKRHVDAMPVSDAGIPNPEAIVTTVAGSPSASGYSGDGGPARDAKFYNVRDVAVGPDGSLYVADTFNLRIRKIDRQGIVTTVAGNGSDVLGGDGGPATAAGIGFPTGIEVGPDGSLYIVTAGFFYPGADDEAFHHRVRRVAPDGTIATIAGAAQRTFVSGKWIAVPGPTGDGVATERRLNSPRDVALDPAGNLYIAEYAGPRIRKVTPDGMMTTLYQDSGRRLFPADVAVAPDGALVFSAPFNHVNGNNIAQIKQLASDGAVTNLGGSGPLGYDGDNGPANAARIGDANSSHVAVAPDGTIYFSDPTNSRIRAISPDRIIRTVAGTGLNDASGGDEGPASQVDLSVHLAGVALGPEGNLYFTHRNMLRKLSFAEGAARLAVPSDDGREVYLFDAHGRHQRTVNAFTGVTLHLFRYGLGGELTSIDHGDGTKTTIERNASRPTAIVAPFGARTVLDLETNGHLATVTNPAGERRRMEYADDGLLTRFEDPRGYASTFAYDPLGRLIADANAVGGGVVLTRTGNSGGHEVRVITALGRATRHVQRDLGNGQLGELVNGDRERDHHQPDGTVATQAERIEGVREATSADGTSTTVTEGADPRFGMLAPVPKSAVVNSGNVAATMSTVRTAALQDPRNPFSHTQLTEAFTRNGRTETTTYDAAIKAFSTRSAAGRSSSLTVNALGQPIRREQGGILPVLTTYDAQSRPVTVSQGSGPDVQSTALSYDDQGYVTSVTDPMGRSVAFEYDLAGRPIKQTRPDGEEVLFGYDAGGSLTSLVPPGRPPHTFSYSPVGQMLQYVAPTVPSGGTNATIYEYDLDGALTKVTRPDGLTIARAYDNAGRLTRLTIPEGETHRGYHPTTGQLATVVAPGGESLAYAYDGGLLAQVEWAGTVAGSVRYTYDTDFRVSAVALDELDPIGFGYDADGLLIQAGSMTLTRDPVSGLLTETTLGNVTETFAYDAFGRMTTHVVRSGATNLFETELTFDGLSRITRKLETIDGTQTATEYDYDLAGRLAEVRIDGATTATYGYDANGNRTHVDGTEIAHFDAQDRLLDQDGAMYSYTANGELESKVVAGAVTDYRYDVLGNLREVSLPNGRVIEYVVDGQNRRIGKKVDGTLEQAFVYQDQLRPLAELDGTGGVVSRFVYADGVNVPAQMIRDGATYRIVTDHLGSPRLVVDVGTGDIIQRIDYDPWGNVVSDSTPGFQPFGFAGGLSDRDTKLVRFGARDYDPRAGRWAAKDPIMFGGESANLFEYAHSDPINYHDPTGYFDNPWVQHIAAVALARAGTAVLAASITNPVGWALIAGVIYIESDNIADLLEAVDWGKTSQPATKINNYYEEPRKIMRQHDCSKREP